MVKLERTSPPESPEPCRISEVASKVCKMKQKINRWNQVKTLLKNAVEEFSNNLADMVAGAENEGGDQMVAESSESVANQLVVKTEKEDVVVKTEPGEDAETTIQLGDHSTLMASRMTELIREIVEDSQLSESSESSGVGDQAVTQQQPEPTHAIKEEPASGFQTSESLKPEVAQAPEHSALSTPITDETMASCSNEELPSKRDDDQVESQLNPASDSSASLSDTVSMSKHELVVFPAASRIASPRTCRSPRTPRAATDLRAGQYLPEKTINKIYCGSRSITNFAQLIMCLVFNESELLDCTNVYGSLNRRPRTGRALDEKKVAYIRQLVRYKGGIASWRKCVEAMNAYIRRLKHKGGKTDETTFGEVTIKSADLEDGSFSEESDLSFKESK